MPKVKRSKSPEKKHYELPHPENPSDIPVAGVCCESKCGCGNKLIISSISSGIVVIVSLLLKYLL